MTDDEKKALRREVLDEVARECDRRAQAAKDWLADIDNPDSDNCMGATEDEHVLELAIYVSFAQHLRGRS